MRDQAEALRLKMMRASGQLGRSIAVVSGKGGVGKSNFSTNFAHALRQKGKRVIIIDMDIGMGNIHILLGVSPSYSLQDHLSGSIPLDDVINTEQGGLDFIAGGSGLDTVVDWTEEMFSRLILAFEQLQTEYDFILFDMGAGASRQSIDLIMSVDEVIAISTTEPTSITDVYSMMKFICLQDKDKQISVVCNRVSSEEEGREVMTRLQFAMRKFLDMEVALLGFLPEDPHVHKAVVAQKPFVLQYPNAMISRRMKEIADNFTGLQREESAGKESGFLGKLRKIFMKGRG